MLDGFDAEAYLRSAGLGAAELAGRRSRLTAGGGAGAPAYCSA